jgi:hypothetical protein
MPRKRSLLGSKLAVASGANCVTTKALSIKSSTPLFSSVLVFVIFLFIPFITSENGFSVTTSYIDHSRRNGPGRRVVKGKLNATGFRCALPGLANELSEREHTAQPRPSRRQNLLLIPGCKVQVDQDLVKKEKSTSMRVHRRHLVTREGESRSALVYRRQLGHLHCQNLTVGGALFA